MKSALHLRNLKATPNRLGHKKSHLIRPVVEALDSRVMMSVSGYTLYGSLATGRTKTYVQTDTADQEVVNEISTVIGSAVYQGHTCIEEDSELGETLDESTGSEFGKQYFAQTSEGIVDYGENDVTNVNGVLTTNDSDVYNPSMVELPKSLTAGTPSTDTYSESATVDGQTTTQQRVVTLTLMSEQPASITVPAGTFQAYEIQRITATNGQSSSTTSQTEYYAPTVGLVEIDAVYPQFTSYFKLASFQAGSGVTPPPPTLADLTPLISKSTVATSIVSGTKPKGQIVLTLTNPSQSIAKGLQTISLYASANGEIDDASILIGSVKRNISVKADKSSTLRVPILPKVLPVGSYTILAEDTDASGAATASSAGPTISVAAPFVQLSYAFGSVSTKPVKPGKTFNLSLVIVNSGNIDANYIEVLEAGISSLQAALEQSFVTIKRPLNIRPGRKGYTLHLRIKIPKLTMAGTYYPFVDVLKTDQVVVADSISVD